MKYLKTFVVLLLLSLTGYQCSQEELTLLYPEVEIITQQDLQSSYRSAMSQIRANPEDFVRSVNGQIFLNFSGLELKKPMLISQSDLILKLQEYGESRVEEEHDPLDVIELTELTDEFSQYIGEFVKITKDFENLSKEEVFQQIQLFEEEIASSSMEDIEKASLIHTIDFFEINNRRGN